MRKFAFAALVLACLSASAQAGSIFDNLLITGAANPDPLGGNTIQDQSRGLIVSTNGETFTDSTGVVHTIAAGGIVSNTDLQNGYNLQVNDVVVGYNSFSSNQNPGGATVPSGSELIAMYSLKVTAITGPPSPLATNPASAIVTFAANSSGTYALSTLLSAGLQSQPGVVVNGTTAIALLEGNFTDPLGLTTADGPGTAILQALGGTYAGGDAALLGISGAAKSMDLTANISAADAFFQDGITRFAGGSAGTQFGDTYTGLNLQSNTSGAILTPNVGSSNVGRFGGVKNQITGVDSNGDFGITISGGKLFYTNDANFTFADSAAASVRAAGFVPEPGSMIVWSVMAGGLGLVARRRRKNSV